MGQSRDELRSAVRDLAIEAGRLILEVAARGPIKADEKSDHSPVTEADQRSDRFLQEKLLALSGDPVISEESALPPFETRKNWPRFWLVDPLDGTRDFVAGTGDYAVCIALIDGDRPVLGVVHAPERGVTWSAAEGHGAFRLDATGEHPVRGPRSDGPRVALISRFHKASADQAPPLDPGIDQFLTMGSALKFGVMADGDADLYLRLTPTNEWDVAAGDCIVTVAGLPMNVPDRSGPLRYNQPSLKVPGFIVATPRLDPHVRL